jgi:hypothetical protein
MIPKATKTARYHHRYLLARSVSNYISISILWNVIAKPINAIHVAESMRFPLGKPQGTPASGLRKL